MYFLDIMRIYWRYIFGIVAITFCRYVEHEHMNVIIQLFQWKDSDTVEEGLLRRYLQNKMHTLQASGLQVTPIISCPWPTCLNFRSSNLSLRHSVIQSFTSNFFLIFKIKTYTFNVVKKNIVWKYYYYEFLCFKWTQVSHSESKSTSITRYSRKIFFKF